MNQIPNIEEVESPLYELKNRIKWDYSYYISREKSANGYWKRVDSIDQVPLHAARTHRTHPVEEPDNLFLYKIYQYLLTHHQQLQKARETHYFKGYSAGLADGTRKPVIVLGILNEVYKKLESFSPDYYDTPPTADELIANRYTRAMLDKLQTIIDRYHSELDQPIRDDWNEDMERSHTLAELDQPKKETVFVKVGGINDSKIIETEVVYGKGGVNRDQEVSK